MAKFQFTAAINVRAYGTIEVEADDVDKAINLIGSEGFTMNKHFSPHGGGDSDFDWDVDRPEIYLENVYIEDSEETIDVDIVLPDKEEIQC